jgi:hypothetical protein
MAQLDPKDLLVRNKVLVGAYALAIVPVILWFVVIEGGVKAEYAQVQQKLRSKASSAKDMAARIGNAENPVYTREDVTRLEQRRALYEKELGDLAGIVNERDVTLERWFEEFKATPEGKQPTTSDFVTRYNTNIGLLVERFKPIVTSPTGELCINNEPPTGDALRKYQKRYWVQEAILEALAAAQKDNPGGPIRLVAKLDFPLPTAPPRDADAPAPAAEMIPARITVTTPFARVPHVIRELLARPIPMRVTRLTIDKEQFTYDSTDARFPHFDTVRPRFMIDGRDWVFEQDTYTATLPNTDAYGGQEHWIPEPNVKLEVVVEVYDFKKIDPPAPPEGAPQEGN